MRPQQKEINWPTLRPGRLAGLGSYTEEGAVHLPALAPKWYLGHNSLPSAPVIQKFPFPTSYLILSSREVVPTWGLSLLGCPHLATVPWQRARA